MTQLGCLEVDDVYVLGQDAGRLRVEAAEGGLLHRGEGGDCRVGALAEEVAGGVGCCGHWAKVGIILIFKFLILTVFY